ncbi:unnamed protein product [Amoebophrya sp. A120]|nr:unnamed protein product [Amoebophrya sp. A120]|eukprot:GSA120T00003455001.1
MPSGCNCCSRWRRQGDDEDAAIARKEAEDDESELSEDLDSDAEDDSPGSQKTADRGNRTTPDFFLESWLKDEKRLPRDLQGRVPEAILEEFKNGGSSSVKTSPAAAASDRAGTTSAHDPVDLHRSSGAAVKDVELSAVEFFYENCSHFGNFERGQFTEWMRAELQEKIGRENNKQAAKLHKFFEQYFASGKILDLVDAERRSWLRRRNKAKRKASRESGTSDVSSRMKRKNKVVHFDDETMVSKGSTPPPVELDDVNADIRGVSGTSSLTLGSSGGGSLTEEFVDALAEHDQQSAFQHQRIALPVSSAENSTASTPVPVGAAGILVGTGKAMSSKDAFFVEDSTVDEEMKVLKIDPDEQEVKELCACWVLEYLLLYNNGADQGVHRFLEFYDWHFEKAAIAMAEAVVSRFVSLFRVHLRGDLCWPKNAFAGGASSFQNTLEQGQATNYFAPSSSGSSSIVGSADPRCEFRVRAVLRQSFSKLQAVVASQPYEEHQRSLKTLVRAHQDKLKKKKGAIDLSAEQKQLEIFSSEDQPLLFASANDRWAPKTPPLPTRVMESFTVIDVIFRRGLFPLYSDVLRHCSEQRWREQTLGTSSNENSKRQNSKELGGVTTTATAIAVDGGPNGLPSSFRTGRGEPVSYMHAGSFLATLAESFRACSDRQLGGALICYLMRREELMRECGVDGEVIFINCAGISVLNVARNLQLVKRLNAISVDLCSRHFMGGLRHMVMFNMPVAAHVAWQIFALRMNAETLRTKVSISMYPPTPELMKSLHVQPALFRTLETLCKADLAARNVADRTGSKT